MFRLLCAVGIGFPSMGDPEPKIAGDLERKELVPACAVFPALVYVTIILLLIEPGSDEAAGATGESGGPRVD